jgi:hypothetical protein
MNGYKLSQRPNNRKNFKSRPLNSTADALTVGKRFKPSDNIFHMVVRGKAGISPVVATVILVAVAIVIAIAVAFWASGLVGVFTRFEKIEIQAAYWDRVGLGRGHYCEKHWLKHRRSRHDIRQRSPMHYLD